MKVTSIILFILASSISIGETLSLNYKNTKVAEVFDYIRENSDLNIAYSETSLVDEDGEPTRITIRADGVSPELALKAVAQASGCKIEKNESIYIVQSGRLLAEAFFGAMISEGLLEEEEALKEAADDHNESVK